MRSVLPISFSSSVSIMNKAPVKNNPQIEVYKEEPPGNRHRIERFDIPLEDLRSRFESPAAGGKKVRTGPWVNKNQKCFLFIFPLGTCIYSACLYTCSLGRCTQTPVAEASIQMTRIVVVCLLLPTSRCRGMRFGVGGGE